MLISIVHYNIHKIEIFTGNKKIQKSAFLVAIIPHQVEILQATQKSKGAKTIGLTIHRQINQSLNSQSKN